MYPNIRVEGDDKINFAVSAVIAKIRCVLKLAFQALCTGKTGVFVLTKPNA